MPLYPTIQESIPLISTEWKVRYGHFLQQEHLQVLAACLHRCKQQGTLAIQHLPKFVEEVPPPAAAITAHFEPFWTTDTLTAAQCAQLLETAPFAYLLVLIGQRWTSGSIKDARAIPPTTHLLQTSCFTAFNANIGVATRALEKHIGRNPDQFWGVLKGNATQKEATARKLVSHILRHKTGWNVFQHYKHGFVYEIRVASGHGMRWKHSGTQFIGFLEPFEQ